MDQSTQIITIILSVGFSQALLGGIMMLMKKNARLPDRILSVWLLSFAFQQLISLLNRQFILVAYPITPFVYGPLLYIYIHSLIKEGDGLKKWYLLTFLPAAIFTVLAIVFRQEQILVYDSFLSADGYSALRLTYAICVIVSFLAYPIATFCEIDSHRRHLKNMYSYKSNRITLGWALFVAISFFVFYFGLFVLGLIRILNIHFPVDPELVGFGIMIFYSFAFSIFGYQQERIYPVQSSQSADAYSQSGLKQKDKKALAGSLLTLMSDEKLYLNSQLSLMDVAYRLQVPRHYVTQVLSQELGKNFYTFVNEYRINEAKRRMLDDRYKQEKLLAIAYDVGFNSKSSFNSLFKQATDMTPSEFRKENKDRQIG